MSEIKNVFISHVHEDDELLSPLKGLIERAGMEVRDSSINSDTPNQAHNEEYIKREILAPRINWAGALVVLISKDTADSQWVNWEIEYAAKLGKRIVGVFARGATDADLPEQLQRCGDAAVVGWQGDRVVDAINGKIRTWDNPETGEPRAPVWQVSRVCQ